MLISRKNCKKSRRFLKNPRLFIIFGELYSVNLFFGEFLLKLEPKRFIIKIYVSSLIF